MNPPRRDPGAKRIAFAIPHLRGGGAERSTLGVARGLIGRGHAVDLVLFDDANAYPDETPPEARVFVWRPSDGRRPGAPVRRALAWRALAFGLRRASQPWAWTIETIGRARFVAAYIARERPDCIFPSLESAKVATILACLFASPRPVLLPVVRNVVMRRPLGYRVLYRLLLPFADRVVAVSEGVADSLARKSRVPRRKIETIYNPAWRPEIDALAAETPDHPWMTDAGLPVVLAAGGLKPVKDFATLLRAFHRLSRRRPARLVVLGEGPERDRLEGLARRMGVADRVSLPGWVPNPYAWMSRAAVFAVSSRNEGFCVALVEALACGCPAVSADCPSGPSEILRGGEVGPLVPVGDDAALAAAMERLLDDPPDKATLKARARFFSVDACVERYDRLIREGAG